MIDHRDFFKGRDVTYAGELTAEIESNAGITIDRANALLAEFQDANPGEAERTVNSGWRPPTVNANTPHAAQHSKHLTGQAVDLSDDDGALDAWLITPDGQAAMEQVGLWQEDPGSTDRWAHVQIVPYGSWVPGKSRTFIP